MSLELDSDAFEKLVIDVQPDDVKIVPVDDVFRR